MNKDLKYHLKINILLFLALITVPGCERIGLDEPYNVRIGTEYTVTDEVSFTIDSISDFRCPRDVLCVWAGDVALFFNIKHFNTRMDTTIYLWSRDNNPFRTGEYTWQILDITPTPVSTHPTDQNDYRIKLLISKD